MAIHKKPEFNILLFIALYFFIKYAFYFYVGLTSEGGKIYSSFLDDYMNFPYWLSASVCKLSKLSLELFGFTVYQKIDENITIAGSRGVNISWGCLGIGAIGLWIAFVTAHRKFSKKNKLKSILAGVLLIFLVNILRIDMIALSNHYNWRYFQSFNAHTTFDILTYAVIVILMGIFALVYNRYKNLSAGNA